MVLVVNGPRGGEVAACYSMAVAQGVRSGMPLVEAQTLVRGLGVAPYEPEADRAALVNWAEACERFSPRVAVEEGAEPESLLFDISNLEHLRGDEARLVEQVEKFFTSRGYLVRLGVAETVGDECGNNMFVIRHSSFVIYSARSIAPYSRRNCRRAP
jgi:protein ImuB